MPRTESEPAPDAPSLRAILVALAILAAVLLLFEFTSLDVQVQDAFFDATQSRWLIDRDDPVGRAIFYTGPKVLIIAGAVTLLASTLVDKLRHRGSSAERGRRLFVLVCLALVPATIAIVKNVTDVHCPAAITRYGGRHPYRHHFHGELEDAATYKRGRCFPAGHASGGFALMSLAYLWTDRRRRRVGLGIGMVAGWTMGLYQMLNGQHYLSHTLVTMLVAWIMIALLARWLHPLGRPDRAIAARGDGPTATTASERIP